MPRTARLFVVSGPSGAGKGTLVRLVRELDPDLALTVSATTRLPRAGEVDGVAYHFLGEDEFEARVQAGEFLEYADVHGHRYGTLNSEVDTRLVNGISVILEIDVQGGFNVRAAYPEESVLIFVEPPSMEELERRLRGRGTEDEESITLRLANARREMQVADEYDVRIVNDDRNEAAQRLLAVIREYENRSED